MKFCPVFLRSAVDKFMCHGKKKRRMRIIIIRNGAKTISLQTLFGRLNKKICQLFVTRPAFNLQNNVFCYFWQTWLRSLNTVILMLTCDNVDNMAYHNYVIKFVSDLRQVSGFLRVLRYHPPIKLTTMI